MKKWLKFFVIIFIIFLSIVFCAVMRIRMVSDGYIFDKQNIEQLSNCQTAVVLGAGVRDDGSMSSILKERAITAKDLYENQKACKIIVSGYEMESQAVQSYLMSEGLPQDIIETDNHGIDTFTSMMNMKYIFGLNQIIIVTQDFHLSRAVYIARTLGMDAKGYVAYEYYPYILLEKYKYIIRDWLASVKAVWQVEIVRN